MRSLPLPEEDALLDVFTAVADGEDPIHVLYALVVHAEGLKAAAERQLYAICVAAH